jgi:glyoxylase-like metal-dependent hydrolase (beta-lactamase superfamily II)
LREHRLKPATVILTHGHIDHMLSVTPVCGAHDIPAYVHPDDRYMLADPLRGSILPGVTRRQLAAMVWKITFTEPSDVRELRTVRSPASAGRPASTWWSTTHRAIPPGR